MRALRLRAEWRHRGDPGLAACLRMVLVHNAAVLLIPLRGGESAYLWMVTRQWGVGWAAAAASLLRWRLQDLLVLCAAAIVLLMPWSVAGRLLALVALILLAANGLAPLWPWLARRSGLAGQAEQTEQTKHGVQGEQAVPAAQGAHHRVLLRDLWRGTGASLGLWSLKIMANGGLIGALAGLPLEAALRAGLGGELGGVQPLQPPAGLGAYEAGVWLAARLPVERAPELVAAALAVHAFSLCIALGAAALAQMAIPPSIGSGPGRAGDAAARRQSGE
jgi:uncharacterized membrane protein YbhN (UPF0104 family)